MEDAFDRLAEMIKASCRWRPVYYFANPGNRGDALIRCAALQFLDDVGIRYRELRYLKKKRLRWQRLFGGTVIYGGGGGWCRYWDHSQQQVRRLARWFNVIVLPSTYDRTYDIDGVQFFCRDRFESQRNMPGAQFCHDMAFYLARRIAPDPDGQGEGCFFRTDRESSRRIAVPADNNDISLSGDHFSAIEPFFDALRPFSVIRTDRLHVAVAACLLGKTLHLYPGGYFKNEAIFRSSIEGVFRNVHFHAHP